ncbi:MAG: carbamoyl phosphate synthase-like protein [Firmicutes bacterium ADurb.Bin456]|nr:MAG: carbamoyl phosphate synthase-like protein [Firmicutes bacterium ADurb.Bin456]
MDDPAQEAVSLHLDDFRRLTRVPLPEGEKLDAIGDKARLLVTAEKKGIPGPKTVVPGNIGEPGLSQLASSLDFPVVIKPRKSSGARGLRYVQEQKDFPGIYLGVHRNYPQPLVQELIPPGTRYDVCLLYNRRSEVRAAFVQKELRHFPLLNGPSTVQESVHRPDLIEMALALMEDAGWYGLAEVEFMEDPRDGVPKLMEVNPRFWASVQAAVFAGIDFPYLLYRLAMEGDIEPHFNYSEGVLCRWLLPGDILHFLFNPARREMDPGFFQPCHSNLKDDIISREDPCAVLGFLLGALRSAADPKMWRKMFFR